MGHNMVLKSAHESKPIRRAAGAESPTFAFHSATGAENLKRSFFLAGNTDFFVFLEARSAAEILKSTLILGLRSPEIFGKVLLLYCCGRCSVAGLEGFIRKVHKVFCPLVPEMWVRTLPGSDFAKCRRVSAKVCQFRSSLSSPAKGCRLDSKVCQFCVKVAKFGQRCHIWSRASLSNSVKVPGFCQRLLGPAKAFGMCQRRLCFVNAAKSVKVVGFCACGQVW